MLTTLLIPALNDNYIYLLHDSASAETAVIDPAVPEPVLASLAEHGWQLHYILNTHHHSDHVGANLALKQATGCQVIAAKADQHRIPGIDQAVQEGDVIQLGQHKAQVLATPGHTSGHIVYHFAEDGLLFCGDTLFAMGCGRLFEGTAEQLWRSLQKLKALPSTTKVYCAHEYTQSNGRFALTLEPNNPELQTRMLRINQLRANKQATLPTTIAEELATNPFLREHSLEIQSHIGMVGAKPVKIIAELRRLKDAF